eukprot:2992479-Amphidinium_carterae.1
MKHGHGIYSTLAGINYEGKFVQDKMHGAQYKCRVCVAGRESEPQDHSDPDRMFLVRIHLSWVNGNRYHYRTLTLVSGVGDHLI